MDYNLDAETGKVKTGRATIKITLKKGKRKSANTDFEIAISEELTELGNAHRLVMRHGADIRYAPQFKSWYVWDGLYWKRDEDGEIVRRAKATVELLFDEAKEIADEAARTTFRKFALKCQTAFQITAMVNLARSDSDVILSTDALDANPMLLGVQNGTIDLATGDFVAGGNREDYITKRCSVSFDPDAKCPNWLAFQHKISNGDDKLIAYKRRLFGISLTGKMVEILFIMHGGGANGKTTEMETINQILGDYAHSADAGLLIAAKDRNCATPEIVAVKGKRAVWINETSENDQLNEKRVKYLAGKDTLYGRALFEAPINFTPTHKPFLRTNHKPKIKGTDVGIWRRIHYVPYLVTISDAEKDEDFRENKLVPELPGILNWCLEGLKDYLANGGLRPPEIVSKATAQYRKDMDGVGLWIGLFCSRDETVTKLSLGTLFDSFSKWANDEGVDHTTRNDLAARLRLAGYEDYKSHGSTVFKGIKLNYAADVAGEDGAAAAARGRVPGAGPRGDDDVGPF
ncbi:MAG: phage/plasmid primase, P4 family [Methylocella sp.]